MNEFYFILKKSEKKLKRYCKKAYEANRITQATEWVTDNSHVLFFAMENAKKICKGKNAAKLYGLFFLWQRICPNGVLPDDKALAALLKPEKLELSECALLNAAAAAAFAYEATEQTAAEEEGDTDASKKICDCVRSLIALKNTDFEKLTAAVCDAELYLECDPANVYPDMSDETKVLYRKAVERGARAQCITESEFARRALENARKNGKNTHIGTQLPLYTVKKKKAAAFLIFEAAAAVAAAVLSALFSGHILLAIPVFFLSAAALRPLTGAMERYLFPPRILCSMDREKPISEQNATLIAISGIMPSAENTEELYEHLLRTYTENRGGYVKVMLLLDMRTSKTPVLPEDSADISAVKRVIDRLNSEFGGGFAAAVRDRTLSPDGEYTGEERKRGAIVALMQYLRDNNREHFGYIFGDTAELGKTRYVMALDSDTHISFGTLQKLTATASHPLNRPVTDADGKVISGYGCIAPRGEISLSSSQKTFFTKLFTDGGTLSYSPVISERSMDIFGVSLFTGKGLIDVDAFLSAIGDKFEKGRILSHDILEGALLRTAFAGDCEITEAFPQKPDSFFMRMHRWVRGDIQNAKYIFRPVTHAPHVIRLPWLSKYHLADNVRRALTPVLALMCIAAAPFADGKTEAVLFTWALLSECADPLAAALSSLSKSLTKRYAGAYFSSSAESFRLFLRTAVCAGLLVRKAAVCADGAVKASVRSLVTHKHLLQWTTASQAEHSGSPHLRSLAIPCAVILLLFVKAGSFGRLFGTVIAVCTAFSLTDGIKQNGEIKRKISAKDRETVRSFAAAAWKFFDAGVTAEENFLPPDNIQETPVPKIAHRTSPTNIGLYLISVMAARDMGLISKNEMLKRLSDTLKTTAGLKKYKGCLYNWYDTRTLEPLSPGYVSTVDCGNFLCCLTALKEGLKEPDLERDARPLISFIEALLTSSDITFLYDTKRDLFHIGYDTEQRKLSEPFYDLYMSEARMTSYYETAKRHVPVCHAGMQGKLLLKSGHSLCAASWTGTMFEFFMPTLFIPVKENSLEYSSLKACLYAQKKRMGKLPYGISESCFYSADCASDYRYKAHGIGALALKKDADDEPVISPYSTFLTLPFDFRAAMKNLSAISALHAEGAYGFYEAIDFTPSRTDGEDYCIVRCYMAHHIGMSMAAMANALFDGIFVKRFMHDRDMCSAESLLCEKMPASPEIFRKPYYGNNRPESCTSRQRGTDEPPKNVCAYGGEWLLAADIFGRNRSIYSSLEPLKYSERCRGVTVTVRCKDSVKTLNTLPETKGRLTQNAFVTHASVGDVKATAAMLTHPSQPAMLIPVKLLNKGETETEAEVTFYFEPSLQKALTEDPHPAFSDMFVRSSFDKKRRTLTFERINSEYGRPALCAGLYSGASFAFETDREAMLPRELYRKAPVYFSESTKEHVCVSHAAAITVKIKTAAGESSEQVLILTCAESSRAAKERMEKIRASGLPELSKGGRDIFSRDSLTRDAAEELLQEIFFSFSRSGERARAVKELQGGKDMLWRFGISGDLPIILLPGADNVSSALLSAFLKLHKRLSNAGVRNDLVMLKNEHGDYFSEEGGEIAALMKEEELTDSKNRSGGVHILYEKSLEADAVTALKAFSSLIYPENEKQSRSFLPKTVTPPESPVPQKTGIGFTENGFISYRTDGLPWCHTLSNRSFGTLLSDRSIGYTWALNSRQNKLTPWSNDVSSDMSGERVLLNKDGTVFDCANGMTAEFTDTFARYTGTCGSIRVTLTVEVPEKGMKKRIIAEFENTGSDTEISVIYSLTPQMSEFFRDRRFVSAKPIDGGVICRNPVNCEYGGYMLIHCDGAEVSAENNGEEMTVAAEKKINLAGGKKKQAVFTVCFAKTEKALIKSKDTPFIQKTPKRPVVNTADTLLNRFASSLLLHQVYDTRLQARCGFYQCSGAYGFRDQLQDILPLTKIYPDICREIITKMCAAQFKEGDVLHWFHPVFENGSRVLHGVRTHCSDDMLWLPFAVAKYVADTGDKAILKKEIPFTAGKELLPGEHDRYDRYRKSDEKATVYRHCLLCFERASRFGRHSLPLILGGDWNDGFGELGIKGKGESVWLAMFMSHCAVKFAKVCDIMRDSTSREKLMSTAETLKDACEKYAWTGDRYLRAFADDGSAVGAEGCAACEIDILPQAWAAIGNMDRERTRIALLTAYEKLFDREHGIIKLFSPPFTEECPRAGYINDYPAGIRENGGQYTHAAVWFFIALKKVGMEKEASEILKAIVPAEKYRTEKGATVYKTEPYALSGDVYSAPGLEGRGGWSLYTGSAGWLLSAAGGQ